MTKDSRVHELVAVLIKTELGICKSIFILNTFPTNGRIGVTRAQLLRRRAEKAQRGANTSAESI